MSYADLSSTGFNLMDMTRSDMLLIRDALALAGISQTLDREKRLTILRIIQDINRVIAQTERRNHEQ